MSTTAPTTAPSVKIFSILGKGLKANTAADLEPYLSELKQLEDVEEVHFGANSLGLEACEAIAEVLASKKSLKIVDLADIFTGRLISEIPQALSALCNALKDHTSLLELDLSDNAFGGRCADAMVPFLSTNQSITTFKLNNNGLGPTGGNIIASAILSNARQARSEGRESKLKVIVCGRNRLENGSAKKWGEAFSHLSGLVEVRMPQNGIRMEGIEDIVKGLGECRLLESLDLQDNTATKSGTRAIVKQLPNWPELRSLNLSDCLISNAGGIALMTALGKGGNKKLEVLKLQYGEFDGRTVELLAVAVAQCLKDLKLVELNGNRFTEDDECVGELKKALEANGHEDALDDLDDMEEPEDDEENEDEDEEDDQSGEDDDGADDGVAAGESGEAALPPADDKATDDLADLLANAHIEAK